MFVHKIYCVCICMKIYSFVCTLYVGNIFECLQVSYNINMYVHALDMFVRLCSLYKHVQTYYMSVHNMYVHSIYQYVHV